MGPVRQDKVGRLAGRSYGDFLLRNDHGAVLPSDTKGGDVCRGNRLESIFYKPETASLLAGVDDSKAQVRGD